MKVDINRSQFNYPCPRCGKKVQLNWNGCVSCGTIINFSGWVNTIADINKNKK
jgi:hypothetical protein